MVSQTVLPFKLESTQDTITAQAGLVLFGEYLHAMGLPCYLDRELPGPLNPVGYKPSAYGVSLVLMLQGGGRSLEDLRILRGDEGVRTLLNLKALPSSDATGDWLRRMGAGEGLEGLSRVQRRLLHKLLRKEVRKEYTLDIDATQIVAEKETAQWTYKGEKGYMPLVGTLAENGLIVGEEFREGNAAPASGNLDFIRYCEQQLPQGKRIVAVRADSAAYQAAIFNACEDKTQCFAIGADLDAAVTAVIAEIPEAAWVKWRDAEIAETVHSMAKTKKAFRLIVVRRPQQGDLFAENAPRYRYTAVASNRIESAADTLAWYAQRGETSENRIKELKLGFGMERMPCGQFSANAVFFRLGVLAYNLCQGFKRWALHKEWRQHQVQTLRWRLYQTAGKLVRHAGQVVLKVRDTVIELFEHIRTRCWQLANEGET
ncbi:MAG TPA: IS1380 family transposase [Methylococcaceae bacterium]|nr:IS1380 family transposase [Methylococcaceae bacterium]